MAEITRTCDRPSCTSTYFVNDALLGMDRFRYCTGFCYRKDLADEAAAEVTREATRDEFHGHLAEMVAKLPSALQHPAWRASDQAGRYCDQAAALKDAEVEIPFEIQPAVFLDWYSRGYDDELAALGAVAEAICSGCGRPALRYREPDPDQGWLRVDYCPKHPRDAIYLRINGHYVGRTQDRGTE